MTIKIKRVWVLLLAGPMVATAGPRGQALQDIPISISTVRPDRFTDTGLADLDDLATRAPITSPGYDANPGANITIRGVNRPGTGSPLFVVDGVPAQAMPDIEPSTIESIKVLKGQAASAIYGNRGQYGVVLVRTRRPEDDSASTGTTDSNSNYWVAGQASGQCGANAGVPLPESVFTYPGSTNGSGSSGTFGTTGTPGGVLPGTGEAGWDYKALGDIFFPGQPPDTESGASEGATYQFTPGTYNSGGTLPWGEGTYGGVIDVFPSGSNGGNATAAPDNFAIPADFGAYGGKGFNFGGSYYQPFSNDLLEPYISGDLQTDLTEYTDRAIARYNDTCTGSAALPTAGFAAAATVISQKDQWAFERVGATKAATTAAKTIVVAVIDTGIDWDHLDLAPEVLWRNEKEIPANGKDDDDNGYVDDVIGWDFVAESNSPWDYDGHGTFVAGIVAAAHGNSAGISGVSPNAKIMALKALNAFGNGRGSDIAQAIAYAADHGANIINLSVNQNFPPLVQKAVDYAVAKGVLVVVAAGNGPVNLDGPKQTALQNVLTVAATDRDDNRAGFSNVGSNINVAAPGVEVVSLRARRTDFLYQRSNDWYQPESAFLGDDKRYYRAAGTSFSTAIASGVAALVWGQRPNLTAVDLKRVLEQSAEDVTTPGRDRFTGYGVLNAAAAITIDASFYIHAAVPGVRRIDRNGLAIVQVLGTAEADAFAKARIDIGQGEAPEEWLPIEGELLEPVPVGKLAEIPADLFMGAPTWTIRLTVEHANGQQREARLLVDLTT